MIRDLQLLHIVGLCRVNKIPMRRIFCCNPLKEYSYPFHVLSSPLILTSGILTDLICMGQCGDHNNITSLICCDSVVTIETFRQEQDIGGLVLFLKYMATSLKFLDSFILKYSLSWLLALTHAAPKMESSHWPHLGQ